MDKILLKKIKTEKINVRQKVDQRAGQLCLPHMTNNWNQNENNLNTKHTAEELIVLEPWDQSDRINWTD